MEIQEFLLPLGEISHIDDLLRFNAHPLQGSRMSHRRNDQCAAILEADEATVEQVQAEEEILRAQEEVMDES